MIPRRLSLGIAALALLATACGSNQPVGEPLPRTTPNELAALIANDGRPVVVNVWASWCGPCRSEAPLLRQAHTQLGEEVRFIGVDVQDTQGDARQFIAEFGLPFENYFDPDRDIPRALGGSGVPITYFFAPGGELVHLHVGVLDEPTLALRIDQLGEG